MPRNIFPQGFSNRFFMISCGVIYYIFLSPVTEGRYLIVYLHVAIVTDNLQCITYPSLPSYFTTTLALIARTVFSKLLLISYSCSFFL